MQRVQIIIHEPGGDLAELQLSGAVVQLRPDWLALARAEAQSVQSYRLGPEHVALACLGSGVVVLDGEHRVTHAAYRTHLLELVGLGTSGPEGFPLRPGPLLAYLLAARPDLPARFIPFPENSVRPYGIFEQS